MHGGRPASVSVDGRHHIGADDQQIIITARDGATDQVKLNPVVLHSGQTHPFLLRPPPVISQHYHARLRPRRQMDKAADRNLVIFVPICQAEDIAPFAHDPTGDLRFGLIVNEDDPLARRAVRVKERARL